MILTILLLVLLPLAAAAEAQSRPYGVVAGRSHVVFEASYPLGEFSGSTEDIAGEVRVDPTNVRLGATGSITVNPIGLRTGIEGRDRDLRKTLETDRYPEIRFTVEQVQASFPSLAERADVTLNIIGMMLIRGMERAMRWSGRARIEEGKIWVRGEAELRLTDFGITPPRKFFLAVGDRVRVSFDLRLTPKD